MGNRSKFTFPVPGRKPKPVPSSMRTGPQLSKAERILGTGTGGINVDAPTHGRSPHLQQWDARSGISISVSESSDGYATATGNTGLGIRTEYDYDDDDDDDEDDDEDEVEDEDEEAGTPGMAYGHPTPWDLESAIIPRQLQNTQSHHGYGDSLRQKRSAATIGHDYRDVTTNASTVMRRRLSNASTIYSHYDPHQVPLAISQQTSSSAMAKGLPSQGTYLLDVDEPSPGFKPDKKKPANLDLSLLQSKNGNKDANPKVEPVLGNSYVMRSPSFVSHVSSLKEDVPPLPQALSRGSSRKLTKLPPGSNNQSTETLPMSLGRRSELSQLHDHYERQLFGHGHDNEPEEPSSPIQFPMPPTTARRFSSELSPLSPPLTTASTIMSPGNAYVTPLSNPVIRPYQPTLSPRNRKDSVSSRKTTTSTAQPFQSYFPNTLEDTSSISSRNSPTSKPSRPEKNPLDLGLQQRSVLSLSDSESDEETFSDSAPMSSMSSHGQASHGSSPASKYTKYSPPQTSAPQDRNAAELRLSTYSQMSDFLSVPATNQAPISRLPVVSPTTLRSSSSSTTYRDSGLSAMSGSTVDSLSRSISARQSQDQYSVHEAKVIAILPVASTADAAMGMPEAEPQKFSRRVSQQSYHSQHNADQPTPPLSPTSVDFYMKSATPPDKTSVSESAMEAHNARFMAVTRQEEMLLAALRKKRAIMRENILAEFEGEKESVANADITSSGGSRRSRQFRNETTSHSRRESVESAPRNNSSPIIYPSRSSSLARNIQDLTDRSQSSLSQYQTGLANKSAMRAAGSSRLSSGSTLDVDNYRLSYAGSSGRPRAPGKDRREKLFLYLDRPFGGLDPINSAEPSPDLSEFLEFDLENERDWMSDDRRRSRARSSYMSGYGGGGGMARTSSSCSTYQKRCSSNPPRMESNMLNRMSSSQRMRLDGVPEHNLEHDDDAEDGYYDDDDDDNFRDDRFDGFSDVMEHALPSLTSMSVRSRSRSMSRGPSRRPESQVVQQKIKGKNNGVRISAVGPAWGDDD